MIAAALLRRRSRCGRRLAAPHRLKATRKRPAAARQRASDHRQVAETAGSGREDDGVLAAEGGEDGGRSAGAELQRIEHGGALKWVKVQRGPCATAVCSGGKVRSGALKVGGTRLSTLHMRSPQPYLRKPRMYFDALAAPRQPRAQALRDETEHAPSQKGGRGYSAALGAGASAYDERTLPASVLAQPQVVG